MNEHNKIIQDIAGKFYKKKNFHQKGKSRLWYWDNNWYIIIIELQPSGFQKGTFLNVGICWLWNDSDYFSFDIGYRVENFHQYQNDSQFKDELMDLLEKSIKEVDKYKKQFSNIESVSYYYSNIELKSLHFYYNAIISHLLSNNKKTALSLYKEIQKENYKLDWEIIIKENLNYIIEISDNKDQLIDTIISLIKNKRSKLKLPDVADIKLI